MAGFSLLSAAAHQVEPLSPRQAVGVNPFPSTFINGSTRTFSALIEERTNENRETTVILSYVKKQPQAHYKRIQTGSIYKSTWKRGKLKELMEIETPSDGLLLPVIVSSAWRSLSNLAFFPTLSHFEGG